MTARVALINSENLVIAVLKRIELVALEHRIVQFTSNILKEGNMNLESLLDRVHTIF